MATSPHHAPLPKPLLKTPALRPSLSSWPPSLEGHPPVPRLKLTPHSNHHTRSSPLPFLPFPPRRLYRLPKHVLPCASSQVCPALCHAVDCSPPGPSVRGTLQAGMLEWVAMPSSRGSSRPRERTHVSHVSCTEGGFFTIEPPRKPVGASKTPETSKYRPHLCHPPAV